MMSFFVLGQSFAPAAGEIGSNAIHKDSSLFIAWANGVVLHRGYLNAADTNYQISGNNKASFGSPSDAIGMAEGNPNSIVSLGDGGEAILLFDSPIVDGPGYDFAVFENSFSDTYLELALVSVSSDGIHYATFDAISETSVANQVGPYSTLMPEYLHNLAGKYRGGFGTPFDLSELSGDPLIDLQQIRFVKIIDCVGSIDPNFGTLDSQGNWINDPFPTPWESGGFDLDAVGVIHNQEWLNTASLSTRSYLVYPNPSNGNFKVEKSTPGNAHFVLIDQFGRIIDEGSFIGLEYDLNLLLSNGIYWFRLSENGQSHSIKLIIQN